MLRLNPPCNFFLCDFIFKTHSYTRTVIEWLIDSLRNTTRFRYVELHLPDRRQKNKDFWIEKGENVGFIA